MGNLEIYGTLGPHCFHEELLTEMIKKGMTGVRLNLSHCDLWEKKDWIDHLQQAKKNARSECALLIDVHGPELRIGKLKHSLHLLNNHLIELNDQVIPVLLIKHAKKDDLILIEDSKILLKVLEVKENGLLCIICQGGILESYKNITIKDCFIKGNVLTSKDIENLKCAKEFHVDALMQPFVTSQKDLIYVKEVLNDLDLNHLKIYAKIENMDGVKHLEEIIPYCDCIVIARGDLGMNCGLKKLPLIQHHIEEVCRQHHHPYMIVTQMLHSMINHPTPTRAEVNDVFQAVYNGASAIMLTGETANGKYPLQAMDYFIDIAQSAIRKDLYEE